MKSKMARPEARRAGGNVAPDDRTAPEAAIQQLINFYQPPPNLDGSS
jgi:hypothetical protein